MKLPLQADNVVGNMRYYKMSFKINAERQQKDKILYYKPTVKRIRGRLKEVERPILGSDSMKQVLMNITSKQFKKKYTLNGVIADPSLEVVIFGGRNFKK